MFGEYFGKPSYLLPPKVHHNTISQWTEMFQVAIERKLGLPPLEALPSDCRPRSLSCGLLAELSDLAQQVSNLNEFQQRLRNARGLRPTGEQTLWEDRFLQPRDVRAALRELRTEFETSEDESEECPIEDKPNTFPKRSTLTRISKSAAGTKISAWTNQLKPTRMAKANAFATTSNDSEDGSPVRRKLQEIEAGLPLGIQPTASQHTKGSTRAEKHSQLTSRGSTPKSANPSSYLEKEWSSDSSLSSVPPSPVKKPKLGRRSYERPMSRQEEHRFFFPNRTSGGQHSKTLKPKIIRNLASIVDFDTLDYPVEVPKKGAPGVFIEFENADDLREYVEEFGKKQSRQVPMLTPIFTESSGETSSPLLLAAPAPVLGSDLGMQIDEHLQKFTDRMQSAKNTALQMGNGSATSKQDQDHISGMHDTMVGTVKTVVEDYKLELMKMGILPLYRAKESETGQYASVNNRDFTQSPQAKLMPTQPKQQSGMHSFIT